MDQVIPIIIAVVASSGFWTLVLEIYKRKKEKKQPTPIDKMVIALTKDKLLFLSKKYQDLGYFPKNEDFEVYTALGQAYLEAGGNSLIKKLYLQVEQLPVKE